MVNIAYVVPRIVGFRQVINPIVEARPVRTAQGDATQLSKSNPSLSISIGFVDPSGDINGSETYTFSDTPTNLKSLEQLLAAAGVQVETAWEAAFDAAKEQFVKTADQPDSAKATGIKWYMRVDLVEAALNPKSRWACEWSSVATRTQVTRIGRHLVLASDGLFGNTTVTNVGTNYAPDLTWGRDSSGVLGIYTDLTKTTKGALTCGAITASGTISIGGNNIYMNTNGYVRLADFAYIRSGGNWGLVDIAPMNPSKAGTLRLYNNLWSTTNYERLDIGQGVAGDAFIRTAAGGTGTRRNLTLDASTITASGAVMETPTQSTIPPINAMPNR